jgi:uncharacterized protein
MNKMLFFRTLFLLLIVVMCGVFNLAKSQTTDYPIQPVPFTSIRLSDHFWAPRIRKNHDVTIPHALTQSENRILNFKIAAKLATGKFQSLYPFDDSDIYKIIEAASYSLYYYPDAALESTIDSLIYFIGMAQETDGYLYTCRTMNSFPNTWSGMYRWEYEEALSHETYNLGHLFESAVAHYQATGKNNYLDIAKKSADLLDTTFGTGKLEKYSGHEIVELGLSRLYRATGDERYLNLAKFFLDIRGPGGEEYNQAQAKVVNQTTAVGHAVRAVYLYSGMADVAALKNDNTYVNAIDQIWEDIVQKKIYVTGGIGASGGNEGFNGDYNLPNASAYCETCASVGNVYFNQRLFLLHGDAKYIDVLERTLYNALLSGISLSGDRFFYSNRLSSTGSEERCVWFDCACCPPNISRLIPSVPGYIYGHTADTLYVNLFMSDTAQVNLNGDQLEVVQTTNYPWNGKINIKITPSSAKEFTVKVRIPGWASNEPISGGLYKYMDVSNQAVTLSVNNENVSIDLQKGYAVLKRTWSPGDSISLNLPMEPRRIVANANVTEDVGKIAIQRGPIVFCAEGIDNDGSVASLNYDTTSVLNTEFNQDLLDGTQVVKTNCVTTSGSAGKTVTFIPYSLWANRGGSEMQVWLAVYNSNAYPDSLIVIDESLGDSATTNYVSSWETLNSIYDLYDPSNSSDKGDGAFGNWASDGSSVGKWNYVQYNLYKKYPITTSQVYWWSDGAGIDIPDSSYISYSDSISGQFVKINSSLRSKTSGICIDKYITDHLGSVETNQIRLNFYGKTMAQGILEWKIYTHGNATLVEDYSSANSTFKAYPIPSNGEVNVELNVTGEAEISVFNLIGKRVYKNTFNEKIVLNESDMGSKGIFLVQVVVGGFCQFKKIIIN